MGKSDEHLIMKRDELITRDADQIAQLLGYGVALDKKRKIDLTFWAPAKDSADALVEALHRNEWPPNLVLGPANPQEENQRWLIRCALNASVEFVTTKENVVTFLLFADKFNCDYDGWGTAVVEAASTNDSGPN